MWLPDAWNSCTNLIAVCGLNLPDSAGQQDAGTYKGNLYLKEEPADEAPPKELAGAVIAFSRNGVSQGIAYR